MKCSFNEYRDVLEGAGPKLAEIVLDRAAHDKNITLWELKELIGIAYPGAQ